MCVCVTVFVYVSVIVCEPWVKGDLCNCQQVCECVSVWAYAKSRQGAKCIFFFYDIL